MLVLESSGGRNVFEGGTEVTWPAYVAYLAQRNAGGDTRGVGPCQITWAALQDRADELGGCWQPRFNCRAGFEHLAMLLHRHGPREAFGQWRAGSRWADDAAAAAYVDRAMLLLTGWQKVTDG